MFYYLKAIVSAKLFYTACLEPAHYANEKALLIKIFITINSISNAILKSNFKGFTISVHS
jgi:hypothetical protein